MILGKMGCLPGPVCQELVSIASEKGYDFYEGDPTDLYINGLARFKDEMSEEELLELAMHERQYRAASLAIFKK